MISLRRLDGHSIRNNLVGTRHYCYGGEDFGDRGDLGIKYPQSSNDYHSIIISAKSPSVQLLSLDVFNIQYYESLFKKGKVLMLR